MTARNEVAAVPTAALDARTIPRLLARVAGVDPEGAETLSWSAEVLKHRTDRRWLIRYTVRSPDGPAARPRVFVGKLYVKPSKAARAFRLTRSLRSDVFADAFPLCIPAPMLLEPKLGLVLQEFVGGADLRAALSTDEMLTGGAPARPHSSSLCIGECMEWNVIPVLENHFAISRTCWRSW